MTVLANARERGGKTVSSGVVAIGAAAMPLWAGLPPLRGYHPNRLEWTACCSASWA
jgi:hypothetical protein